MLLLEPLRPDDDLFRDVCLDHIHGLFRDVCLDHSLGLFRDVCLDH